MSLANISIVGNLVKAPEQVQFNTGHVKTNLQVAVNNPPLQGKEKGTADFYQVELWGKLGDLACKYLGKGNQVAVSGRFQLDRWQDRDGKERMTPVIRANQLSLPPRLRVVATNELSSPDLESTELESSSENTDADSAAAMVSEEFDAYEVMPGAECVCEATTETHKFPDNGDYSDEFPKQNCGAPTVVLV